MTLILPFVSSAEDGLKNKITELTVALEDAQKTQVRLKRELEESQRTTEAIRSRYAELLMKTDKTVSETAALQLAAVHLMRSAENGIDTDPEGVKMLQTFGVVRRRLLLVAQALENCEKKVGIALDTCKATSVVQDDVKEELLRLKLRLEECMNALALVENEPGAETLQGCSVVLIDKILKFAVIDQGFLHGIRVGQHFEVRRQEKMVVSLEVVECRPMNSVLMLIEGDFSAVVPGILLHRHVSSQK